MTHIKEVAREMRGGVWLERRLQDIRYGGRALRRSPSFAGALAVTRVLTKSLFEVKPTGPATLLLVAGTIVAVALVAGFVPALRATRVDPLSALPHY